MTAKWFCYLSLLFLIAIISLIRWRLLSKGEKIIGILISITLVSEITALSANYKWHNNMPVYHIFNPIEFFLISQYFNCSIDYFRKRNIGLIIGIFGTFLSGLNTLFLQRITTINSNFLLFEGTSIIIYCLLALHQILLDEEHLPYKLAHFWITLCCLIYWSSTFTGWGLYALFNGNEMNVILSFDTVLTTANYVFYLGIGATLVFYKRLIPTSCA